MVAILDFWSTQKNENFVLGQSNDNSRTIWVQSNLHANSEKKYFILFFSTLFYFKLCPVLVAILILKTKILLRSIQEIFHLSLLMLANNCQFYCFFSTNYWWSLILQKVIGHNNTEKKISWIEHFSNRKALWSTILSDLQVLK